MCHLAGDGPTETRALEIRPTFEAQRSSPCFVTCHDLRIDLASVLPYDDFTDLLQESADGHPVRHVTPQYCGKIGGKVFPRHSFPRRYAQVNNFVESLSLQGIQSVKILRTIRAACLQSREV